MGVGVCGGRSGEPQADRRVDTLERTEISQLLASGMIFKKGDHQGRPFSLISIILPHRTDLFLDFLFELGDHLFIGRFLFEYAFGVFVITHHFVDNCS